MPGQLTRTEIESQPEVWRQVLANWSKTEKSLEAWRERLIPGQFIFTGCGATYALGLTSAAHFQHYGITAQAFPASEMAVYPEMLPPAPATLVAISRSGMTSETLWAVESFRKRLPDSPVIVLTTRAASPLGKSADFILEAAPAQEGSVVETRSFSSMLLISRELAAFLARDTGLHPRLERLPQLLEDFERRYRSVMQALGADLSIERFFFLGSGSFYGLALEGMYKIKQMAAGWAEAYHPMEFRHGPITLAGPEALIIGFIGDRAVPGTLQLLFELQERGARCLAIVDRARAHNLGGCQEVLEIKSGLNEWERGVMVLPPIHWLAYYRALRLGRDPDKPTGLQAVTLI